MKIDLTKLDSSYTLPTNEPRLFVGSVIDPDGQAISDITKATQEQRVAVAIADAIQEVDNWDDDFETITPKILLSAKNSTLLDDTDVLNASLFSGLIELLFPYLDEEIKDVALGKIGRVILDEGVQVKGKVNNEIICVQIVLDVNDPDWMLYVFYFGDGEYKTIKDSVQEMFTTIQDMIESM